MFTVSTPCFLSFWDFRTSFFFEEAWFWGVRVGFGGREGALASALIRLFKIVLYTVIYISNCSCCSSGELSLNYSLFLKHLVMATK